MKKYLTKGILLSLLLFSPSLVFANDYHVLSMRADGRTANIVFHIPIPVENNSTGTSLRTALSQYIDGANYVSKVPWIQPGELTQIQNGELYEHSKTVKFLAADTNGQKQTKIDNRYTSLATTALNKIRAILKFWGMDRNVP